jgi:phenylalanyl-tRNA synthetase alpha chain
MDLHPNEVRILKAVKEKSSVERIAELSGLDPDAVNRTVSWLSTKGLVKVEETAYAEVSLDAEGRTYADVGLPERRLLELAKSGDLSAAAGKLDASELGIALGWLRKKNLAKIVGKDRIEVISDARTADEDLLAELKKKGKLELSSLSEIQKAALMLLRSRRNVVRVADRKNVSVSPTEEGMRIGESSEVEDSISQLTPELLRSGGWRKGVIRPYDVGVYVKPQYAAKKHPLQRLIEKIEDIFVAMGFKEINGPLVESAFWNFDALFVPQDHPAREMQDTFYLKKPESAEVPQFKEYGPKIKEIHENGGSTGSVGWGYKWNPDLTKQLLLRTHTTAVTCKHLTTLKKENLPAKVYCVGKVFRNEAVDYKHLPEFYQVEGIVVDPDANFRNLLGILHEFYRKMGFSDVRFRPSYYPYTELSVDPEVYLEGRGWMELGGAGIFRPEVVKPLLGFECPVLAWGLGLDRVVALSLGLSDIRDIYISDLDWLRKSKVV